MALGVEILPQKTGRMVRVAAEGRAEWTPIGTTIAWELVTANAGGTQTLSDDTPVYTGEKALRYGTVLTKLTGGAYAGKWAPFVDGAANGQGTLRKGECGILDVTLKANERYTDMMGLITGGLVWKQRVNMGVAPLPTQAQIDAAMPRLEYTPNE